MPDDVPRSDLEPVPDCLIELGLTTLTPESWALIKELNADLPPIPAEQRDRLRLIFRSAS